MIAVKESSDEGSQSIMTLCSRPEVQAWRQMQRDFRILSLVSGAIGNLQYNRMNAMHTSYQSLAAYWVCSCIRVTFLLVIYSSKPHRLCSQLLMSMQEWK